MDEALDFILDSTFNANPSEIHVPKLKAYSIMDLVEALKELLGGVGTKQISIRPGEKIHETLINYAEMKTTWENSKKYVIQSPYLDKKELAKRTKNMKRIRSKIPYSSDMVPKLTKKELKKLIIKSNLI
jgi:FlaA1/EpsC-like NDP-sugar epimerase